jgi:hypothetical protein
MADSKRHPLTQHFRGFWAAALLANLTLLPSLHARSPKTETTGLPRMTGILEGKLTDARSVPLPQAVLIARNLATGATTRIVTGTNGSYRFDHLDAGEYRLEAQLPQLGNGAVDGILVSAGHATRVQAALVMQLPIEVPEVETELHELDPIAAAVSTLIDGDEMGALPLPTRNWQEFAAITPAANPGSQAQNNGQLGSQTGSQASSSDAENSTASALDQPLSIEGASGLDAGSSIDGMPVTPGFRSGGRSQNSAGPASLGSSAIESMTARTGEEPSDSAVGSGSTTSLATRHGQNALHGQVFFLARQNFWSSQNPYTQWIQESAPASGIDIAQFAANPYTPPNSRQSFGLGAGGRFKRDKLYWFGAVDGLLRHNPAIATVRHPDDFFARPTDPELTVLAARLGLPGTEPIDEAASAYSSGLEQLAGLLGPVPRHAAEIQGFGRIDWQINDRQHLSAESEVASEDAPGGAHNRSSETYGSHSFGNSEASSMFALARWDSFFTANLLNTSGVEFRRLVLSETPQTPSTFEAPLIADDFNQLPEIIADSKYGFILGKPARLGATGKGRYPDERVFAAQEMLSWVRGAHLIKVGGFFDHTSDSVNTLINQTGTYSYADVLNLLSDVSAYEKYGIGATGDPYAAQHNCDATGRVSTLSDGTYTGLGYLSCYAWYSQRIGPSNWHLSTNDLAAYVSDQWQPLHNLTVSAGVRFEMQQLPGPISTFENPDLPDTEKFPGSLENWGPRFGVAWSPTGPMLRRTVLRAGAGLYYGRIDNSVTLAALSQTGAPSSDLNFFFKPTDTGAPPFPYVFSSAPQTVVTPGAVAFARRFKMQEVDQAVVGIEQELPSHWLLSVNALASLGRRLPISIDTNLAQALGSDGAPQTITYDVVDSLGAGPIKTPTITVPFYTERLDPDYQQLASIESRANSTYDAAMIKIARYGSRGLTLRAHYLYAHATDWNPNESSNVAGNDVLDPGNFSLEYGTSNLDIRHSAGATVIYNTPWKLRDWAGYFANGWAIAGIGQFRSGLPFTMRTSGYIPGYYRPLSTRAYQLTEGVAPGINGSGGDNRIYGIGRNTYRYPATWTADTRISKRFLLANHREVELLAESYNLFNHQNVTLLETTGYFIDRGSTNGSKPTFNFLTGLTKAGLPSTIPEFGKPLDVNATNYYRPREFQFGVRARF